MKSNKRSNLLLFELPKKDTATGYAKSIRRSNSMQDVHINELNAYRTAKRQNSF